jgi:hypothetical protein
MERVFYEDVFRALNRHRVRYLIVGGIAVNLSGVPRMTRDLDRRPHSIEDAGEPPSGQVGHRDAPQGPE